MDCKPQPLTRDRCDGDTGCFQRIGTMQQVEQGSCRFGQIARRAKVQHRHCFGRSGDFSGAESKQDFVRINFIHIKPQGCAGGIVGTYRAG